MSDKPTYPTVSDLKPPSLLAGEYKKVGQIVGERILVEQIADWQGSSKYGKSEGKSLIIKGIMEDKTPIFFFVSHDVLYHKFDWLREKTPFVAVIFIPEGVRYYDVR